MTKEDAIKILNTVLCLGKCDCLKDEIEECLKMAIEALIRIKKGTLKVRTGRYVIYDVEWLKEHFNTTEAKIYGQPSKRTEERTEMHACDYKMNKLTKIKDRILARIEMYIGDIELAEEKELTEDEKTIFESVKDIILEEFDRVTPSNTEHIIKTTIKEYIDKDYDDVTELLLALNKDLCEHIRKEN